MRRCPHCGKPFTEKEARMPGQALPSCPWCGRSFPAPLWPEPSRTDPVSEGGLAQGLALLLSAAFAFGSYATFASELKGPEFIVYYIVLLLGLLLFRFFLTDELARLAPVALFEGVGLWRWVDASAKGMHRFGFLFALMLIGGLLLLVQASSFGGGSSGGRRGSSSSCSSGLFSSCGSSCSGGGGGCGGGGGGCGGCGGS